MEIELKNLINNKKLATFKVMACIGTFTKTEISETLNITRPTLDSRLKTHNWRFKELEIIIKKFNF